MEGTRIYAYGSFREKPSLKMGHHGGQVYGDCPCPRFLVGKANFGHHRALGIARSL